MKLLQLIRANNLFLIILTQIIVKYFISNQRKGLRSTLSSGLNDVDFTLLLACTVIIAAAGYIINDYHDYDLDHRAGKNVGHFTKDVLLSIYQGLVMFGAALSLFLAIRVDLIDLYWFYPGATVLLLLYSSHLKPTGLPANILVSSFTSAVVGIVVLSEYRCGVLVHTSALEVLYAFMLFAFLTNLFREIIKDAEDYDADFAFGLQTLPIRIGLDRARLVAAFLGMIGMSIVLSFAVFHPFLTTIAQTHTILLIFLPLSYLVYKTFRASHQKDYSYISRGLKILMLAGLTLLLYP